MEKRKGFTLIELLVVIAIISLMLAILIPSLKRTRNQARFLVCQSNLKQWGVLLLMRIEGNQGHYLFDVEPRPYKFEQDASVFKDKKISFCPMAVREGNKQYDGSVLRGIDDPRHVSFYTHFSGTLGSAFESWSYDSNNINISKGSYGFNIAFFSTFSLTDFPGYTYHTKISRIYSEKIPSNIPLMLDSASTWSTFAWEGQKPRVTEEEETSCCINRHDGGVNCLFLDWSVRKVGLKELWKLKWYQLYNTNGPWTIAGGVKPEDWPQWMREFKDY
ncbi:MAG: prepilin-type N-terminal cleavage/methylation domain-containing protein [Sedimentisphaerales bacterium]|nr:prepilin-type N-terminal cleavage/methylation domain-containing protein [Sedimentisphaerales bacterium]